MLVITTKEICVPVEMTANLTSVKKIKIKKKTAVESKQRHNRDGPLWKNDPVHQIQVSLTYLTTYGAETVPQRL